MDWLDSVIQKADEGFSLLSNADKPLVLFGAGDKGRGAHKILSQKGIKIECFCDNNGRLCLTSYRDTPIYSYDMVRYLYPRYIMLLTMTKTKADAVKKQVSFYNIIDRVTEVWVMLEIVENNRKL